MKDIMGLEKIVEDLYWGLEWKSFSDVGGDYGCFYERLKAVLLAGIAHVRKEQAIPALSQGYLEAFAARMQKITMRALIFEMEVCEECGELAGDTDEEKYRFYTENYLNNPERLKEIYAEYPLLYKDMIQLLAFSVRNVCEALERFEQDEEELRNRFFAGKSCGGIKEIGGGDSDSHNGGRTVLVLTLGSGDRVAYKPRSLAVEERYRSFLLWVCEKIDMPYWWNPIWDRGAYGWCGWVESRSCKSYEELERYYQRNGILLCISYLLGSEDLHYENLIACGEYPVIVDLEMGVGSRGVKPYAEGWAEPQRIFQESVLQTGILPMYAWNADGEGVNVGAVNGAGGQLVPLELPVVVEPGTVRMRVEYRQPVMKEGKNLATLKGRFIQPYEFIDDMEEGFERTYRFLAEEKKSVREHLAVFYNVKVRCLLRQTQEYSMMLTLMHHPDFLIGMREREELLERGGFGRAEDRRIEEGAETKPDKDKWIRAREAKSLEQGDIPYFWYMPGKESLYSGTDEGCDGYDGYFPLAVMECTEQLLQRMNSTDLERQKRLMRTALLLGVKSGEFVQKEKISAGLNDVRGFAEGKPEEPEVVGTKAGGMKENTTMTAGTEAHMDDWNIENAGKVVAERIGRLLLEEAIWSEDRQDVGWISIIMVGYRERGYLIRPMGPYLYDGLAGVAIFFHRLAGETGKKHYQDVAELLIQKLISHTKECLGASGNVKLDKMGGWNLTEAGHAGESEKTAENAAQDVPAGHVGEGATGAFTGEASIAFVYMLLYSASGEEVYLKYLKMQCAVVAEMLPKDKNYDVLGGNAGAVLVLLEAYKMTGDRQYIDWAEKAGDCLLEAATSYEWGLGWVSAVTGTSLTGFAHGAAGIMLALAKLYYYTGDARYLRGAQGAFLYEEHYFDAEKADWKDLRFPDQEESGHEMAWCHGWGGIVMARKLAEKYVDGEFRRMLRGAAKIVEKRERMHWKDSYCLCHGSCGNLVLLSLFLQETAGKAEEWAQGQEGKYQEGTAERLEKGLESKEVQNKNQAEVLWEKSLVELSRHENIRELLEVQECGNYGFMAGISGIGYSCLCGVEDCRKIMGVEMVNSIE